jgi:hypothetical protein
MIKILLDVYEMLLLFFLPPLGSSMRSEIIVWGLEEGWRVIYEILYTKVLKIPIGAVNGIAKLELGLGDRSRRKTLHLATNYWCRVSQVGL